ncbi:hypothetical protein ASE17_20310 [Phenylobacterium sp. Root77]|jgi:pimeloyl-ACP methyl ester carboxylesterase|uniref:alpha/beta fold hydrolase n=1 Tax=unclassified Phenylobacterium TaxID=2640670 RepID=UPI0007021218|nr:MULTISPECIES: alpha/beta hydrolase [unclassified Phenylobacterium]KQW67077.1 hypothetical protein ASC73_18295 [Phenylobacterium sp. Root1277]KQW89770.1 hypothetical protein ASC79_19200 [Phenylobacterium sp. Root1290]KRC43541.1 hypothetical protein ASE17_20310 [Phenylobacterium sp. Root77]
MPLLGFLRFIFGLLALAVVIVGGYFVWSWWRGDTLIDLAGRAQWVRGEVWRLWLGAGMLAWAAMGRAVVLALIAHRDKVPSHPRRGLGEAVCILTDTGRTLYVEQFGPVDGPRLILTHGWGMDSTIWWYARGMLARRFRVVVWDMPGLGISRRGRTQTDLEAFADDLAALVKFTGSRPAVLVGHSIGGMVIQTLLARPGFARNKVLGAVLLNTTYTNPLRTMVAAGLAKALRRPVLQPLLHVAIWLQPLVWASAWLSYLSGSAHMANRFGFGRFVTRSQLEHVTLLATRNPPGEQARGILAMFRWDGSDSLHRLDIPVLVIGGDLDLVTKLEASEHIARTCKLADLVVVEDVNHMGMLERAEVYNDHIAAFADQLLAHRAWPPTPPDSHLGTSLQDDMRSRSASTDGSRR